jgi:hypothetical protein
LAAGVALDTIWNNTYKEIQMSDYLDYCERVGVDHFDPEATDKILDGIELSNQQGLAAYRASLKKPVDLGAFTGAEPSRIKVKEALLLHPCSR